MEMIAHHAVGQNLNTGKSLKLAHCSPKKLLFFDAEDEIAIDDATYDMEVPGSAASGNESSRFAPEV